MHTNIKQIHDLWMRCYFIQLVKCQSYLFHQENNKVPCAVPVPRGLPRGFSRASSRPEITIEMRGFQWLGDSYAGGNELKTVNIGGMW